MSVSGSLHARSRSSVRGTLVHAARSHDVALASKPEPSVVQAVLLVRRSGRYAPPEAVRVVPEVRDGGVR